MSKWAVYRRAREFGALRHDDEVRLCLMETTGLEHRYRGPAEVSE